MGAVVGVLARNSDASEELAARMLLALKHRGTRTTVTSMSGLGRARLSIGFAGHRDPEAGIFRSKQVTIAFDGSLYDTPRPNQARAAHDHLIRRRSVRESVRHLLQIPGGFAGVLHRKRRLYAFRDVNGLKPLHYASDKNVIAIASERKALWRVGFKEAKRVLPGHLCSAERGIVDSHLMGIPRAREVSMTMNGASSQLKRLLRDSIRRVTKGKDRVAVAFSGGLDSAVTAVLAKACVDVQLVGVGLSSSTELPSAEKFARDLDLPITIESFSEESLEVYVRRVLWLIEEPNLMKVSVAIPLHWAAKVAADQGLDTILCGQGSDELYGGYYRYARILDSKGRRALSAELHRSIMQAHEVNYERDEQATSLFGVELRTPFADHDVIKFSMTIPLEFKVKPGNDLMRKWVLRAVGKKLGLTEEIVGRRKKAIQHGTGVENAIRKLAKSRGLSVEDYMIRTHAEVVHLESMP